MKQIVLSERVRIRVDGSLHESFCEGFGGVTWLAEQDKGVQVRFDSGLVTLVPWSNITIAFYS